MAIELIKHGSGSLNPLRIIVQGCANAREHRAESGCFGPFEFSVCDIKLVNHLRNGDQCRIILRPDTEKQRLETAAVLLVREFGVGHIETQFSRRGFVANACRKPEFGLVIDETTNQPGTGDAVHVNACARHPGPPFEIAGIEDCGMTAAMDICVRSLGGVEIAKHGVRTLAAMRPEEIERRDIRQAAMQLSDFRN